MKLDHILQSSKLAISCEFFPPKTDKGEASLWQCIQELQTISPAYVSVTYGAGGSTRDRTRRIVERIKKETDLEPVAHLTCVGSTEEELATLLNQYRRANIENILALRGDPAEGVESFQTTTGGFSYASDLTAFVQQHGDFAIAVATYPEGHPESVGGVDDDVRYLKLKQDHGACAAITQYFFDNDDFYRFRDKAVQAGISIPIIPGIMPINNYEQIVRFSSMCGASISDTVHKRMQPVSDSPEAQRSLGIEIATEQCRALIDQGVQGLHFYTLNRSAAAIAICREIGAASPGSES